MAKGGNTLSKTAVWILLGLLIVGLAGFGATNLSGTVRSIGSVGETDISTSDYFRALQNEIRAIEAEQGRALPFQEAQARGLPDRVLSQLVISAALEEEARRLGISVGDMRLAQELRRIPAFQGPDGQFDREAYRFALENAGLSEAEFEEDVRADSASSILQGAVLAGITMPDAYVTTLIDYAGERRAFTWAPVAEGGLDTGLPTPTDAELQTWYDDNIGLFTLPRTKQITYAWLTPDMILDSVEVDDATLRAAYEEQEAQFNMPERRLVERLVLPDMAAAEQAAARIAAGDTDFETLVAERGLALADADMGDVTRADLRDAADAVFALTVGQVAAAPSPLGPALYRVNAVLPAQETPFEEAVPALRDTLALDRARRVIETQAEGYNDELAAGATLEELANTTDLRLGQIGWTGTEAQGIAGYPVFREAAQAVTVDDFPEIDGLGDGGIFALRLDEVIEPRAQPFDAVRDRVQQGWEAAQRVQALVDRGEDLAAQLAEGRTFDALGLDAVTEPGLTRNAAPQGLPPALLQAVFDMQPGETRALPAADGAVVLRLDDIIAADRDSDANAQLTRILQAQAANDVATDLFRAMATDIQQRLGVEIDRPAINAVHSQFQ